MDPFWEDIVPDFIPEDENDDDDFIDNSNVHMFWYYGFYDDDLYGVFQVC